MKPLKALLLTTWLYSLLLWIYIVMRIIISGVIMTHLFISSIPYLTFAILGMISFTLSFVSLFAYLVLSDETGERVHEKLSTTHT